MHVHSFPPIEHTDAHVLILGTMPGKASLRAHQYYAHPQNAFWKITAQILGFDGAGSYDDRRSSLTAAGCALWDVLKSCTRTSSLDSDIDGATIVINDFTTFFADHPKIRRVCFNGAKAETLYLRHVRPCFANHSSIEHIRLPSTSPANASIPFAQKLLAWRVIARVA